MLHCSLIQCNLCGVEDDRDMVVMVLSGGPNERGLIYAEGVTRSLRRSGNALRAERASNPRAPWDGDLPTNRSALQIGPTKNGRRRVSYARAASSFSQRRHCWCAASPHRSAKASDGQRSAPAIVRLIQAAVVRATRISRANHPSHRAWMLLGRTSPYPAGNASTSAPERGCTTTFILQIAGISNLKTNRRGESPGLLVQR